MNKSVVAVKAAAGAPITEQVRASVTIHEEIGGWGITASQFVADLRALGDVDQIELSINSPGGDVLEAWAIHNALRSHNAKVTANILGYAASAATVVMLAADEVTAPENAYILVHNPWTLAMGDADDIEAMAKQLRMFEDGIVAAYAAKTGKPDAELRALMNEDRWMTADEAKEWGFVDTVTAAVRIAACAAHAVILGNRKAPVDLVRALTPEAPTPAEPGTPEPGPDAPEPTEPPASPTPPAEPGAEGNSDEGIVGMIRNFFSRTGTPGGGDVVALRGELATARAEVTTLTLERDEIRARVDAMASEVATLRAERRDVIDTLASLGLSADAAANLPGPNGNDEPKPSTLAERWAAVKETGDQAAIKAFYAANKTQLDLM